MLRFATPRQLFDRDFPGQYLRLIKQVRVSIVALIPPNQGIRATLANHGISRVVVEDDVKGFRNLDRAAGSPVGGVERAGWPTPPAFSICPVRVRIDERPVTDVQSGLLLPFEGLGVDTAWEFILPESANPFDFTTIADVLVTIDYTCPGTTSNIRSRSCDSWIARSAPISDTASASSSPTLRYDLNNPQQSSTP